MNEPYGYKVRIATKLQKYIISTIFTNIHLSQYILLANLITLR